MKYQIEIKGIVAIIISALLLIIIGTGWFYWFEWRPNQIRKECLRVMGEKPNFANEYGVGEYKACLIERGLEK